MSKLEKIVRNDDTRDVAIRIVEYLIDNEYIIEFEDEKSLTSVSSGKGQS